MNTIQSMEREERCVVCLLVMSVYWHTLADRMGIENTFNKTTGMSGGDWLSRFMKKVPRLNT